MTDQNAQCSLLIHLRLCNFLTPRYTTFLMILCFWKSDDVFTPRQASFQMILCLKQNNIIFFGWIFQIFWYLLNFCDGNKLFKAAQCNAYPHYTINRSDSCAVTHFDSYAFHSLTVIQLLYEHSPRWFNFWSLTDERAPLKIDLLINS